jgi:hypothetical protein
MPTYAPQTDAPRPHVPAGEYEGEFIAYTLEKDKPDFEGDGFHDEWRFTADFGEVEDSAGNVVSLQLPFWCTVPRDGATVSPKSKLWSTYVACGLDPLQGVDIDAMMEQTFVGIIDDKERPAQNGLPATVISKLSGIRAKRAVRQRVAPKAAKPQPTPAPVAAGTEAFGAGGWDNPEAAL